jgi:hypothetical protein
MAERGSIVHKIHTVSECDYGYFHLGVDVLKNIFPENKFDVYFEGEKCSNRKIDWKRNRLNLYPLRHYFKKDDLLKFVRVSDNVVDIFRMPHK